MFLFTYRNVVSRPTPTASPGGMWTGKLTCAGCYKVRVFELLCTQGMLDDEFSTQYDKEGKTFLDPPEDTA